MSRYITPLRTLKAVNATRTFASSSINRSSVLSPTILNSVESTWKTLSVQEQEVVESQLKDIQKQDWSKLSLQEKRAAYYVAFGPHGPREPAPKVGFQVFIGTIALMGSAALTFMGIRALGQPAPHTVTKEWQEATNEIMKQQKANPISGYTSENYKGKGWVDV